MTDIHVCYRCGAEFKRPPDLLRHFEQSHLDGAR